MIWSLILFLMKRNESDVCEIKRYDRKFDIDKAINRYDLNTNQTGNMNKYKRIYISK